MKGGTVQINWHSTKPVLTLDFHPFSGLLATGCADFDIELWVIDSDDEQKKHPQFSCKCASLLTFCTECSIEPIAILAGVRYAAITDIAWSPTGKYLALSSQDGYCTLLEFENQELGSSTSFSEEKKVVGGENSSPIMNKGVCDIEAGPDHVTAAANNGKAEEESVEEKQASSIAITTPAPNKPAKRRITPMAID